MENNKVEKYTVAVTSVLIIISFIFLMFGAKSSASTTYKTQNANYTHFSQSLHLDIQSKMKEHYILLVRDDGLKVFATWDRYTAPAHILDGNLVISSYSTDLYATLSTTSLGVKRTENITIDVNKLKNTFSFYFYPGYAGNTLTLELNGVSTLLMDENLYSHTYTTASGIRGIFEGLNYHFSNLFTGIVTSIDSAISDNEVYQTVKSTMINIYQKSVDSFNSMTDYFANIPTRISNVIMGGGGDESYIEVQDIKNHETYVLSNTASMIDFRNNINYSVGDKLLILIYPNQNSTSEHVINMTSLSENPNIEILKNGYLNGEFLHAFTFDMNSLGYIPITRTYQASAKINIINLGKARNIQVNNNSFRNTLQDTLSHSITNNLISNGQQIHLFTMLRRNFNTGDYIIQNPKIFQFQHLYYFGNNVGIDRYTEFAISNLGDSKADYDYNLRFSENTVELFNLTFQFELLDTVSSGGSGLIGLFANLISYINPFHNNFILKQFNPASENSFFRQGVDGILDMTIPNALYFENKITSSKLLIENAFPIKNQVEQTLETIKSGLSVLANTTDLSYNLPEVKEPFSNQILIEAKEYNFNDTFNQFNVLRYAHNIYLLVIDAFLIFSVINLTVRNINKMLGV